MWVSPMQLVHKQVPFYLEHTELEKLRGSTSPPPGLESEQCPLNSPYRSPGEEPPRKSTNKMPSCHFWERQPSKVGRQPSQASVSDGNDSEGQGCDGTSTTSTDCPDARAGSDIMESNLPTWTTKWLGDNAVVSSAKPTNRCRRMQSFQVVWCFERSNKPDMKDTKNLLMSMANKCNANVACIKKAEKFLSYLGKCTHDYVLVTDWREVKPCIEMLETMPDDSLPKFVAVICQQKKQYENASYWATNLNNPRVQINVLLDFKESPG
ncbi:unnamed protein product, partial [Polarella glacialis]